MLLASLPSGPVAYVRGGVVADQLRVLRHIDAVAPGVALRTRENSGAVGRNVCLVELRSSGG